MCTVSVIGWPGGLRLVSNRDEQRRRRRALPPERIEYTGVYTVMPIDPVSNGTWISVNEYGLAIALLNVNRPDVARLGLRSRGEIVPKLAGLRTLDAAARALGAIDISQYAPFRVICAIDGAAVELAPHLSVARSYTLHSPIMFTSSGLGDDRVETPRRALFERMMGQRDASNGFSEVIARQDAFHQHRWADAPELSVRMAREEACTVSRTVIEAGESESVMIYSGLPSWRNTALGLSRR